MLSSKLKKMKSKQESPWIRIKEDAINKMCSIKYNELSVFIDFTCLKVIIVLIKDISTSKYIQTAGYQSFHTTCSSLPISQII